MSEQETVLETSFSPQVFNELKRPVEPVESMDTLNDSCLTLIPVHLLLEPLDAMLHHPRRLLPTPTVIVLGITLLALLLGIGFRFDYIRFDNVRHRRLLLF